MVCQESKELFYPQNLFWRPFPCKTCCESLVRLLEVLMISHDEPLVSWAMIPFQQEQCDVVLEQNPLEAMHCHNLSPETFIIIHPVDRSRIESFSPSLFLLSYATCGSLISLLHLPTCPIYPPTCMGHAARLPGPTFLLVRMRNTKVAACAPSGFSTSSRRSTDTCGAWKRRAGHSDTA